MIGMINGVHAILFSKQAARARTFLRDKLGFKSVDAGGWLIFALPPAELGVHPTRGRTYHELYLTCADIETTKRRLAAKDVKFEDKVVDAGWGLLTRVKLPDGTTIGLYEPRHARPTRVSRGKRSQAQRSRGLAGSRTKRMDLSSL